MAPTDNATVDELKSLVNKLELRVQELEGKLTDGRAGANPLSAMRMVIMGPPGAGKVDVGLTIVLLKTHFIPGKGTQAPNIRDKYCVCHLVSFGFYSIATTAKHASGHW